MKLAKRDLKLLLILAGLVFFLLLYLLVFNPAQTRLQEIEARSSQLTAQVQELETQYLHMAEYEAGIDAGRKNVRELLESFPGDVKEEDILSYLLTMEAKEGICDDFYSEHEKRKHIALGTGHTVRRTDVCPIHRSTHRISGTLRNRTSSVHGKDSFDAWEKAYLDLSLFFLRTLECLHDILGMQRYRRRRPVRDLCQRPPDVYHIRAIQTEQKEIQRHPAIHLPDGHMDSMGTILFRCRDIMAMACARQFVCKGHMGNPVV